MKWRTCIVCRKEFCVSVFKDYCSQFCQEDRNQASFVFVLRNGWRVSFLGQVCSPTFSERGPAEAYLSLLRKGRKPEVSQ